MYLFIYSTPYSCIHPSDIHVFYLHMYLFISMHRMYFAEKCPASFFPPHFSLFEPNNKRYEGCREGSVCLRITRLFFRIPLWRQMTVFRALLVHIVGGCRAFKIRACWLTMSWTYRQHLSVLQGLQQKIISIKILHFLFPTKQGSVFFRCGIFYLHLLLTVFEK